MEHSLSPKIHNYIYQYLELPFEYEAVVVHSDFLSAFVHETIKKGRPGFNVTIPHKESIIPFLDEMDSSAGRIGAVNTVLNHERKLKGFNTDVIGFWIALERGEWSPKGKVMLLGAGGGARAAVEALALLGVEQLIIFDLIPERVTKLKTHFEKFHDMKITEGSLEKDDLEKKLPEIDLLINATPVGMWPKVDQSPLSYPELIPSDATVFDMVYKPVETSLLKQARSREARTISGLTMLVAQAIAADEIWLDRKLPEELLDKITENLLSSEK